MYRALLIIIGLVFVLTLAFAFLIWYQLGKFADRALAAKKRQEEYVAELTARDPGHPVVVLRTDAGWDDIDDEDRSGWI